jgi:hypothetical protein
LVNPPPSPNDALLSCTGANRQSQCSATPTSICSDSYQVDGDTYTDCYVMIPGLWCVAKATNCDAT